MANLPSIENAFLVVDKDRVVAFGSMNELLPSNDTIIDCGGKIILPTWCDSHTHLVFAAFREDEFVQKLQGVTYAEIAAKGGGILNSAKKLAAASEQQLFDSAAKRIAAAIKLGTGALEIKSGYGLNIDAELKMLRVIKQLKQHFNIQIKATFLAAHALPREWNGDGWRYINEVVYPLLPIIQKEQLADFVDVFCEQHFFTVEQMTAIIKEAKAIGLKAKVHVNQLNSIGGLQAAIAQQALSVDHLETMTADDIALLGKSNTIGTLLPTAAFFLRMPMQPARSIIEAGAAVALASDFNPGSSPSFNMNFVVALSCIQMKMLPSEAINAATINGAFAMQLEKEYGSLDIGKKANFIITQNISSIDYLPYSFGENCIESVFIDGELVN